MVGMRFLPDVIFMECLDLQLSFRDGPKDQTRNLEIPRCANAHLRFASAMHPGMTLRHLCSSCEGRVALGCRSRATRQQPLLDGLDLQRQIFRVDPALREA